MLARRRPFAEELASSLCAACSTWYIFGNLGRPDYSWRRVRARSPTLRQADQEPLMSSVSTVQEPKLRNYVNGAWRASTATEFVEVINPATAEVLTSTPLSTRADVDSAGRTPADAFPAWRRPPPGGRIPYLF